MCGRTRFGALAGNRMRQLVRESRQRRRNASINHGIGDNNDTQNNNTNNNTNNTDTISNSRGNDAPVNSDVNNQNQDDELFTPTTCAVEYTSNIHGHTDNTTEMDCSDIPYTENFGPGMFCPVLVNGDEGFEISRMAWGLIPTYFPADEKGNHFQLFNKRIEGLAPGGGEIAGKYFLQLMKSKRCVALFDGFYEWKVIAGKKQPYYVHFKNDEPLIMPGIYEDSDFLDFRDLKPLKARTFAILTGHSCAEFEVVHSRQPIFLTLQQTERWLDPHLSASELEILLEELRCAPSRSETVFNSWLHFYPVTKKITDMKYQQTDCIKEVSLGRDMTSFFAKREKDDYNSNSETTSPVKGSREANFTLPYLKSENVQATATSISKKPYANKTVSNTEEVNLISSPQIKPKRAEIFTNYASIPSQIEEIDLTCDDHASTVKQDAPVIDHISNQRGQKRGIDAILKEERQSRLLNTPIGKFFTPDSNAATNSPSPKKRNIHRLHTEVTPTKHITQFFKPT